MANFMPGEYDWQIQDAERKRKFADLLRQTPQPQGQMVGNVYVAPSWTQRLAAAVNQYQGNQQIQQADQQEKTAYQGRVQQYKDAGQRLADALRGKVSPEINGNQQDDANFLNAPGAYQPQQVTPPGVDDVLRAQVAYGNDIGDPNAINAAATNMVNNTIRQQDRADDRNFRNQGREDEQRFRSEQAQLQREAAAQALQEQIAAREQAGKDSFEQRKQLAQMQMQNSRDLAQFSVANRSPQSPVAVMGPDGKPVYVAPGQAYGQRPYSAKQEQQDAIKAQQQEQARLSAQQVLDQADNLFNHPGRSIGTGWTSAISNIPGTDARGFKANLDTFKAQTFVPMVSALKGMGALSDAEGRKLSESVGALDPSMPEAEFEKSLKTVTKTLYDKAKASGLNVSLPAFADIKPDGKIKKYNPSTGKIE